MRTLVVLFFSCCISLTVFSQNYSLQFDGSAERVSIPAKDVFNLQEGYTIEAWIYANTWKALQWQGSLITQDAQGPDRGYAFRCGDNGKLSFVASVGGQWEEVFTPSLMNVEQWHHIAVVIANGTMKLYIDGSESASAPHSGNFVAGTLPLTIGASAGFGDRHFDGRIDEIRMWNVARTQSELADNIAASFTGTEPGLVAYFPMDDGSGTTLTNLVDAECSGALVAMDDTNWSEGYTIPDFDISMGPITSIDVLNMKSRPIKMSVDVKNNGTKAISNVAIAVSVNGSQVISETIVESIASGELLTYILETPIDLTETSNPEIEVVATHPDDQNILNNSKTLNLISSESNSIRLFDARQHNFGAAGQSQFNSVRMPGDLSEYGQLLLHIDLDCPGGGCDPWDQPAKITAVTSEGAFEIARYVTPYGIACGPWTVDVTDFKDVLTGPVTFQSYIQVWGGSGWLLTLDLEMVEGTGSAPYSRLSSLWQTDYQVYGDPGISYDLPEISADVASNTETSHIRMTISGHGQGNTQNAAEFSQMTHAFVANGQSFNDQFLWKDDCAENACADQAGTWLFPRAGWCPGQEVQPYSVNTTGIAPAGSTTTFDYQLQEYTNLLNTGYNDSGHTEPHYRIWSYFIEESSSRYEAYTNIEAVSITADTIIVNGNMLYDVKMTIRNNGSEEVAFTPCRVVMNGVLVSSKTGSVIQPGETDEIVFDLENIVIPDGGGENVLYGIVDVNEDQNIGDDVVGITKAGTSSTIDLYSNELAFEMYPNPSAGVVTLEISEENIGSQIQVFDAQGRQMTQIQLLSISTAIEIEDAGVYMVKLTNKDGFRQSQKLIIH